MVEATLSARTEGQLAQATVELVHSRAPLLGEPLPAAAIDWACALTATVLARGPALSAALSSARRPARRDRGGAGGERVGGGAGPLRIAAAGRARLRARPRAMRGERDDDDLVAVSPRSGRAVSAAEAEPYAGKLLPLPRFVREGGQASWPDILDGLALTGHFLMRDLITDRAAPVAEGARPADRALAPRGRTGLALTMADTLAAVLPAMSPTTGGMTVRVAVGLSCRTSRRPRPGAGSGPIISGSRTTASGRVQLLARHWLIRDGARQCPRGARPGRGRRNAA